MIVKSKERKKMQNMEVGWVFKSSVFDYRDTDAVFLGQYNCTMKSALCI
jgi:hypothetical protein